MTKLPQRPRSHILEKESRIFVEQVLPTEWIIDNEQSDYGVDLVVEIVKENSVTGAHFLMQLKSTDKLIVDAKGFVSHSCETSVLNYFLQRPELVIYLVYDSINRVGYWIWIQDFLRRLQSLNWRKQSTLTVKIPKENLFTKEAIKQIETRVLGLHPKEKLVNIIESLDHPLYEYNLELSKNEITVSVLPKYPGTDKDVPIYVDTKFNFDDSAEGKKASLDWKNAIRKGTSAKIDARFVESIKTPDIFGVEMFFGDEFELEQIEIEPIARDIKFPAKIEVLDKANNVISQLPYIEFREVRHGTDESLLSNEEQDLLFRFNLLFNFVKKSTTISYKLKSKKIDVSEMEKALSFQKAVSEGCWLLLVNLKTGHTVVKHQIPSQSILAPSQKTIEIAEKLALVQQKMNILLEWPSKITNTDLSVLEKVVNILTTGYSLESKKMGFEFDKVMVQELASRYRVGKLSELVFESQNKALTLLGRKLMFGPIKIYLPNPRPTEETLERFSHVDAMLENEKIQISFDVDEPGVIIQYINWMSGNL